jgi:hypothetical protein
LSSVLSEPADNIISLPSGRLPAEAEAARRAAAQVRMQLSLLQGYADLMEGLSPKQNIHILKVIGEKVRELTAELRPFLEDATGGGARELGDYRRMGERNRQLMVEYRLLVRRLRETIKAARELPRPASLGPPGSQ